MVNIYRDKNRESYDIRDLLNIVRILRAPGGCPWDREQTHKSLRQALVEEAYEAVDAIDRDDAAALREELGDVLLQVIFHADLAAEEGAFDFDAVCDGICKKLIFRHPHVFGDRTVRDSAEVLKNWDDLKKEEKGQTDTTQTLKDVPRAFPALMRAQKVQKRAAKVGFDWDNLSGALEKLREELAELEEAAAAGDGPAAAEELGDLLFSAVNAARFLDVSAEEVLTASTDKFIRRFGVTEELAKERGIDMRASSLAELDKLWDEAKHKLSL